MKCVCGCSFAYECAHCRVRLCWSCDMSSVVENIKTAVKWCPDHERDGKMGRLSFFSAPPASE